NGYRSITDIKYHSKNSEPTRSIVSPRKIIESFDFEDYQRYESHNRLRATGYRTKSTVLPHIRPTADLQIHLAVAQKIGVLQFDQKNLKEIPPEICSLSGLRTLSLNEILQLNGNLLCSLPASFSYLTTLKQLNLSKNNFLTIPRAILYLTNLQVLDLSANRIQEINDDIEFLEVDELNLNNNQISQISTNISKCKRLKILRLDNNKLKLESIPTSLLKNCTVFQLSVNGNFFEETQFQLIEGYDDYERRYTANQRKRDATAILLLN
ncbi:unnamed protein product, partial [Adineta steineri]